MNKYALSAVIFSSLISVTSAQASPSAYIADPHYNRVKGLLSSQVSAIHLFNSSELSPSASEFVRISPDLSTLQSLETCSDVACVSSFYVRAPLPLDWTMTVSNDTPDQSLLCVNIPVSDQDRNLMAIKAASSSLKFSEGASVDCPALSQNVSGYYVGKVIHRLDTVPRPLLPSANLSYTGYGNEPLDISESFTAHRPVISLPEGKLGAFSIKNNSSQALHLTNARLASRYGTPSDLSYEFDAIVTENSDFRVEFQNTEVSPGATVSLLATYVGQSPKSIGELSFTLESADQSISESVIIPLGGAKEKGTFDQGISGAVAVPYASSGFSKSYVNLSGLIGGNSSAKFNVLNAGTTPLTISGVLSPEVVSLVSTTCTNTQPLSSCEVVVQSSLPATASLTDLVLASNGYSVPIPISLVGFEILPISSGSQHSFFATSSNGLFKAGLAGDPSLSWGVFGDGTTGSDQYLTRSSLNQSVPHHSLFSRGKSSYLINPPDNLLYSTGLNSSGSQGIGAPVATWTQSLTSNGQAISGVVKVASNFQGTTTVILLSNGTLKGAGLCGNFQLGSNCSSSTSAFVDMLLPSSDAVSDIKVGENYVCALTLAGTVFCRGGNDFHQISSGSSSLTYAWTQVATNAKSIEILNKSTVVLDQSGLVYCQGLNNVGQCGIPDVGGVDIVKGLSPVTSLENPTSTIASSFFNMWAISYNGTLTMSGPNTAGQLGTGAPTSSLKQSNSLIVAHDVHAITPGPESILIVKVSSLGAAEVFAAGHNSEGQLGLGDTSDRLILEKVF